MPTGLTQDAGREIGVSRTIHRPLHQERLASAVEREERRTYWKGVLDRVVAELA
ncbi:hypothetical protein ACFV6B_11040 [Streptomyces microflavus]|uniref:hypothetical protein n=1 Tax=Streptomyces microflavus TaxID=1919 RepID=UPI00365CAA08